jgi:hypothetical protein
MKELILARQPMQKEKGPRAKSGGYTLSVLLVMVVALGVLMDKAHLWAPTQLNREREAELIYRGQHLARGIAIFRQKTGRYPTSLGEVESLRPRVIRRVYKDPMTEHGEWTYLYNVPTSISGNNEGLPIIGVRSASIRDSIKVYQNRSLHSDWEFSALDPTLGVPPPNQPAPGGQLGGNARPGQASGGEKTGEPGTK